MQIFSEFSDISKPGDSTNSKGKSDVNLQFINAHQIPLMNRIITHKFKIA